MDATKRALNPICCTCLRLGSECRGITCQVWSGCTNHLDRPPQTYTAQINGAFYAFRADLRINCIFGIGPDEGKRLDVPRDRFYIDARTEAILAVCSPFSSSLDAYHAARDAGDFQGRLRTV